MPSHDYIPEDDAGFRDWLDNFARRISAEPGLFALSPADAASIQGVADRFVEAYTIAVEPITRTRSSITAKDDARSIAESLCRQYAADIKLNRGVTDGDKINLGVRPINPRRTKIACPQSVPNLQIVGSSLARQMLRFNAPDTPDSRAKPFGAKFIEIWVAIGDEEDITNAKPVGLFTANPVTIEFKHEDDRKKATYHARWVSARGETGPWSLPVSMSIAA